MEYKNKKESNYKEAIENTKKIILKIVQDLMKIDKFLKMK